METLSSLRKRAALLEPTVRIGKKGLTPSLISEIDTRLSKLGLVKIKILRASLGSDDEDHDGSKAPSQTYLTKDELIQDVVKKTNSALVQQVGMVFTLYRTPISSVKKGFKK